MDFLDSLHNDLVKSDDLDRCKVMKENTIEEEIGKYSDNCLFFAVFSL